MGSAKQSQKNGKHLNSHMNDAYFTVKHGLSLKKYLLICKLQQKNGLDMGNNYLTDKACSRFINSVSKDLRKCQKEEVNKARFLSVLSDD